VSHPPKLYPFCPPRSKQPFVVACEISLYVLLIKAKSAESSSYSAVFFSHNKSVSSTLYHDLLAKRTRLCFGAFTVLHVPCRTPFIFSVNSISFFFANGILVRVSLRRNEVFCYNRLLGMPHATLTRLREASEYFSNTNNQLKKGIRTGT